MATRDDDDPEINFVPGLYKIFDEILVNACDNFQRDPEHMTYIKAFGVCVDDRNMLEIYSKSVLAWHVGLETLFVRFLFTHGSDHLPHIHHCLFVNLE